MQPYYLSHDSELENLNVHTIPIKFGDVVVIATDGITNNVPIDWIQRSALIYDNEIKNRAKALSELASKLSLSINPGPFATKGLTYYGIEYRGGRSDESTAVVLALLSRTINN